MNKYFSFVFVSVGRKLVFKKQTFSCFVRLSQFFPLRTTHKRNRQAKISEVSNASKTQNGYKINGDNV